MSSTNNPPTIWPVISEMGAMRKLTDNNHYARGCTYDKDATRKLLGDSCRDLTRVVLRVFNLVGRGAVTVMDNAKREVCGPAMHKCNAQAELLANAEQLNKLLEEAETREEKASKNKFNPFNRNAASTRLLPAATTGVRQTCDTGLVCFESNDVERSSSFFGNLFRKDKRTSKDASQGEAEASTADDDVDTTDSKKNLLTKQPRSLTPNLLKKLLPPRDKPSQLKVKVLMIPREEEPAPGGGGNSHNRPLKIVVPESAIVVSDDAEEGDAACEAAEVGEAVPEPASSSFSEDLFVLNRQQLDLIEVDFKDSKKTTSQEDNCSATKCPSTDTTDEMLKDDNADNIAHRNYAKKEVEAVLHH